MASLPRVVMAASHCLEVETKRPGVQGHPWLHTEFKASMCYLERLSQKREKKETGWIRDSTGQPALERCSPLRGVEAAVGWLHSLQIPAFFDP